MTTATAKLELGQVFIIDDDPAVCDSVAFVLNSVGYHVRAFHVANEFLTQQTAADPIAVLVDLLLPGMTGLSLCREIVARRIPCSFAVISGHADVHSAVESMRLGAIDLLEKPFSRQRLLEVVNHALQVARLKFTNRVEEEAATRRMQELSPRERNVFDAIAAGLVTKEIAKRLDISVRTIDVHRSRIMQKLGLESPLQLATLLTTLGRVASQESAAAV